MRRTCSLAVPVWALLAVLPGCGRPALPDPRQAARAYADAAVRGDSDGIYSLLTRDAQRSIGRDGARRLVADSRRELALQGQALARPGARVDGNATVPLADGTEVELSLEADRFRVDAAATLPSAARTPAAALEGLRRALSRRSYVALLRVLSQDSRSAMEGDLRALVRGLEDPRALDVRVNVDRAEVELPGGHFVTLKREGGVWRVEDLK